MTNRTTQDFRKIVLADTPLIDVRAPIEFEKGAFPNAVNLPIMTDEERHVVGIKYKEAGNEAATVLGHELVAGDERERRVKGWLAFIKRHEGTMIYCFRGGARSRIAQTWIEEALGQEILRLEGGYKAFRHYLINQLTKEAVLGIETEYLKKAQPRRPILLGGYTGSGKTILLNDIPQTIDLEGIAHHRGSSFGEHVDPQPSQINFENTLAYVFIKHQAAGYQTMVFEDEGRHVGRCFLPKELSDYLTTAELVVLDRTLEERIEITLAEYVTQAQEEYCQRFGIEEGLKAWQDYIIRSMTKVQKRLGLELYKALIADFEEAFAHQISTNDPSHHQNWISHFLTQYYDPMYAYQLANTTKKIIYQGNANEVRDFLISLK